MELLSNCCGASIDGLNADNIGICSECKEGCGVEEVVDMEVEVIDIFDLPKMEKGMYSELSKLSDTNQ